MNCPYCNREIYAFTGLQELFKFEKHLARCRKNPANIVLSDGQRTVITPTRWQNLKDALEIRADSGQ
jgi:hypothetical protein